VDAPKEYFGQVADAGKIFITENLHFRNLESFVKEHRPDYTELLAQHLRFRMR